MEWKGIVMHLFINGESVADPENVPAFFREAWTEQQGDPIKSYETWKDHRRSHEQWFQRALVLFLIEIFGFVGFALMTPSGSITNVPKFIFCACIVAAFMLFSGVKCFLANPIRQPHCHQQYFEKLDRLYLAFDIVPSPTVGRLTPEEFRSHIEEMLIHKGRELDDAPGFRKVPLREQLRNMHRAALEWNLCHKSWEHYFPKKRATK
jgi:hypothetical protein